MSEQELSLLKLFQRAKRKKTKLRRARSQINLNFSLLIQPSFKHFKVKKVYFWGGMASEQSSLIEN